MLALMAANGDSGPAGGAPPALLPSSAAVSAASAPSAPPGRFSFSFASPAFPALPLPSSAGFASS